MALFKNRSSSLNPFYGYPAEFIRDLCGVSIGTAEHYKAGRRKPPTPTLRLFRLYRDMKVLGKEWDGYSIHGGKLFCPDGRYVTEAHISHLALVCHLVAERCPEEYKKIVDSLKIA